LTNASGADLPFLDALVDQRFIGVGLPDRCEDFYRLGNFLGTSVRRRLCSRFWFGRGGKFRFNGFCRWRFFRYRFNHGIELRRFGLARSGSICFCGISA